MISAGKRDRYITIQRASVTEVVVGAPQSTWSTHKTIWVQARPITAREQLRSNREVVSEVYEFDALYCDVLPTDRIQWNAKTWDIVAIREVGRREGIVITAEARK